MLLSLGPSNSAHEYNLAGTQTQPRSQVASGSTPPSQQSLNYRTVPIVLESYYDLPLLLALESEYLSDREIHLVLLRQTSDLTLWVLLPSTALRPFDSEILTIPAALQLLEATHLISYERGLLCIPPRRRDEPEPWENHPIMQSLLKRLQSKWRTHRAQATTLSTPPGPNPAKPHLPKPKRPLRGSLPHRQCTLVRSEYATAHHPLQPMPSSPRGGSRS
jgi:hypothetical protein